MVFMCITHSLAGMSWISGMIMSRRVEGGESVFSFKRGKGMMVFIMVIVFFQSSDGYFGLGFLLVVYSTDRERRKIGDKPCDLGFWCIGLDFHKVFRESIRFLLLRLTLGCPLC